MEVYGEESALDALLSRVNDFPRIIRIHASNAITKIEDKIEEICKGFLEYIYLLSIPGLDRMYLPNLLQRLATRFDSIMGGKF